MKGEFSFMHTAQNIIRVIISRRVDGWGM